MDGNILDDPVRLKAERESADRIYNDALTALDRAIQRPPDPAAFPQPPPPPDDRQVTPLNTLWQITAPLPKSGLRGSFAAAVRRVVAPLFEQQQAFNSAVVDHINRNLPRARHTSESIAGTLGLLRTHLADLARFETLLMVFLQQITPYVDTRDRDVAGLLRGLSGAINAVADELMKRSEALLARDARREMQLRALDEQIGAVQARLDDLARALAAARRNT